jgi:cytochrome c oxidase subunit II
MTTRSWQRAAVAAALLAGAAGSAGRATAGAAPRPAVKEFTVVAERYKFTPDRIEVNQGDTVRITLKSADGTHGFAVKKLKVEQTVPKGGQPVTVEFVAGTAGSFSIACSEYCGKGHSQMKGILEVVAAGQGGNR